MGKWIWVNLTNVTDKLSARSSHVVFHRVKNISRGSAECRYGSSVIPISGPMSLWWYKQTLISLWFTTGHTRVHSQLQVPELQQLCLVKEFSDIYYLFVCYQHLIGQNVYITVYGIPVYICIMLLNYLFATDMYSKCVVIYFKASVGVAAAFLYFTKTHHWMLRPHFYGFAWKYMTVAAFLTSCPIYSF